ncbi:hypothetical protein CAPTEDRAFT_216114 [Capitella teleta]|uniref:Sodium-dependent multivitamin transporter n=1 Tax=Capitella teleta TaxID=283909 RepID=R7TP16_CAPTE|nr:hypothetical protein CAPTEDRAFT_216114 [Capitella teleta]|eukprot:ELT95643.1 hypothetical protein CAPTEDRAFT_216114 [Capitella teleta]
MVAEQSQEFEWYDYLIFVVTLMAALGIGVYYALSGNRNATTKSYLTADRSLAVIPVALSMFMSYISAILVLGNTAEMYTFGANQWFAALGSSIAYGLSAIIFVPLFFPLKITSAFEVEMVSIQRTKSAN